MPHVTAAEPVQEETRQLDELVPEDALGQDEPRRLQLFDFLAPSPPPTKRPRLPWKPGRTHNVITCAGGAEKLLADVASGVFGAWTTDKVCQALSPGSPREDKENCVSNSFALVNVATALGGGIANMAGTCPYEKEPGSYCAGDILGLTGEMMSYGSMGAAVNQDCADSPGWILS